MNDPVDIAIIGAGAAGLMAAIYAGRTNPDRRIVALDSAKKLGAKILISGGGRCNVTHDIVDESTYAGSSRHAIRKVLRRFDASQTVEFFLELGVALKREDTGKLFPVSDSARAVLDALLGAARDTGVELAHPYRVEAVERHGDGFLIRGGGDLIARKVILATGGRSIPKSGSDGHGYRIAQSLGHTLTPRLFQALVPLTLPRDHFIGGLAGVTLQTRLDLRTATGKIIQSFTDSTLCAHFGLTGPSVLDMSRYFLAAQADDPSVTLTINWLPEIADDQLDADLRTLGRKTVGGYLSTLLPERLARALCDAAGIEAGTPGDRLARESRHALVSAITQLPLPITGSRGYDYAEVTAGGVPLSEIHLETMESRVCPGLYLIGEICDVDGRIGGYNFQWAWASGYVAGTGV